MQSRMRAGMPARFAVAVACATGAARGQVDFTVTSALGDSLTDTPAERGPNHAEQIAEQLGVALNNFAVSGSTTGSLIATGQHTDAVDAGTTFAFLWIGANDLLFEFNLDALAGDDSFVDGVVANWATAADALLDGGADVITANVPNIASLPGTLDFVGIQLVLDNLRSVTISLNQALAAAAAERGIPVVDTFSLFEGLVNGSPTVCGMPVGLPPARGAATDLFFDEIHPTSYGMGLVTNAFIEVMNDSFGTELVPLTEPELGVLAGLDTCNLEPPPMNNDADGDGVVDDEDVCPGANDLTDTDGDGTPDCIEACPDDPAKLEPGACGCGVADTDTDADGTPDCNDGCPDDANKIDAGGCGCGVSDADTDADGVFDCIDNCPDNANTIQTDSDGDGIGDACDLAGGGGSTSGGICALGITSFLPLMWFGVVGMKRRLRRGS